MPVERVLAKIGKKHRVEAKMDQNENTGLTGVYGKIWRFKNGEFWIFYLNFRFIRKEILSILPYNSI